MLGIRIFALLYAASACEHVHEAHPSSHGERVFATLPIPHAFYNDDRDLL
jgi:hypothetical protein